MKRLFYIAAAAMAVLSACTKENPIVEVGTEPESVSMPVFKATIEGPATKTTLGAGNKVNWDNDDEVFVRYQKENYTQVGSNPFGPIYSWLPSGPQVYSVFRATPNPLDPTSATLTFSSFLPGPNFEYNKEYTFNYKVVYPASLADRENPAVFVFPATQTYNGDKISFAPMYYSGRENSFAMKNAASILAITVPASQMASVQSITVSSDEYMNGYCEFTEDESGDPVMTIGSVDAEENKNITLVCDASGSNTDIPAEGSKTFYICIPVNRYRYLQIDVTDGETTKRMRTNNPSGIQVERNRIYPITFAENYSPAPAYEYVDLGLSVKWATFNVGATAPEEYGDYFAWGAKETEGYSERTYKYSHGSSNTITKYCFDSSRGYNGFIDNKVILEAGDDVANVNWGGSWRMPTDSEMYELYTNCTWTWTTINGVNGYKVQSNIAGYTDNWIFLPAAGLHDWSETADEGIYGNYWSSSLNTDNTYMAYYINFSSSSKMMKSTTRYDGFSIRPVYSDDPSTGVTGVSLDITSTTIEVGKSERLSATVSKNSGAVNNQVEWSSSDTAVATVDHKGKVTAVSEGTATITAWTFFGGFTANCEVTVVAEIPVAYQYVDLGLSVKWATFNVGATRPEESGDYFAWGDPEPYYEAGYAQENPQTHWKSGKTGYNWASYKHCNGQGTLLTKYCFDSSSGNGGYTDSKTVLDMEDDAARVNWGGSWRMPTKEEIEELFNDANCTKEIASINDVAGFKFTSKKTGFEGNWIFLPATGLLMSSGIAETSQCYIWSSSINSDNTRSAYFLLVYKISSTIYSRSSNGNRNCGLPVRPVCE